MTAPITTNENNGRTVAPWPAKYRPTRVEELALEPGIRRLIEQYENDGAFPNLLLHGPPGVGKSSLARLLINSGDYDQISVNGGTDHSVEYMRGTVRTFVRTKTFRNRKVVLIDEAEGLSREAQLALRDLMEKRPERVSFIIITNCAEELDAAVKSRCTEISMSELPLSERVRVLERVLEGEGHVSDDITVRRFAGAFNDLRSMLSAAERSFHELDELRPPATTTTRGGPRLLREIVEDPEFSAEVPWDLEPFTARGSLTLVAGPPKLAGKSTLLRHYAAAKTLGLPFLGQHVARGKVLWVGPDENINQTARDFLEWPGLLDEILLWSSPPNYPARIEDIVAEVERIGIDLVVADTLPKVAGIQNENDNSEWNRWADKAMPLIRESGAAFVAVHHHRKSGGSGGSAFRGGSAIFAFVDIGISLTPGDTVRRRTLTIEGSRFTLPETRMIELTGDGYVDLGNVETDDGQATRPASYYRVRDALGEAPLSLPEVLERLTDDDESISGSTVRRRLGELVKDDEAVREGSGARGDPHRWRRAN